jgi:hypothetical protein
MRLTIEWISIVAPMLNEADHVERLDFATDTAGQRRWKSSRNRSDWGGGERDLV